jgi:dimethylsulfone monooxygenase
MNMARRNRQLDTEQIFDERKRCTAGLGAHPLIGSPQTIAREQVRLQAAGIDGVTLSCVDFKDEGALFIARVLPLLREAGLRRG